MPRREKAWEYRGNLWLSVLKRDAEYARIIFKPNKPWMKTSRLTMIKYFNIRRK